MKRFLILLLLLFNLSVFAQQTQMFLKFKSLNIDGESRTFVEKLKDLGYSELSGLTGIEYRSVRGEFAEVNGCSVFIFHSIYTNKVYEIEVVFPNYILNVIRYRNLKGLYSLKYGNGAE